MRTYTKLSMPWSNLTWIHPDFDVSAEDQILKSAVAVFLFPSRDRKLGLFRHELIDVHIDARISERTFNQDGDDRAAKGVLRSAVVFYH